MAVTTQPLVRMVDLVVVEVKLLKLVVQVFNPHKILVFQIFNSLDLLVELVDNISQVLMDLVEVEVLAVLVVLQIQPVIVMLSVVLLEMEEQIPSLEHPLHTVEVV